MSKQDGNWEKNIRTNDEAPVRFLLPLLQEIGAQEGEKAHPPCTAQQTPPTVVWVCTHLLCHQLFCNSLSGIATRLRVGSFNKWSSCTNRACMWERMGMGIFKCKNSHQPQFEHRQYDLQGNEKNVLASSRIGSLAANWAVDLRRVMKNVIHSGWQFQGGINFQMAC